MALQRQSESGARFRVVTNLGQWRETSVVFLFGEHDYSTRGTLESALAPLTGHVVIDLSWCEFVDSSVIAVMLAKHVSLASEGGRVELVAPPTHAHLMRSVETLGIRTIVGVHDDPGRSLDPDDRNGQDGFRRRCRHESDR
jgi:anti-anti-sigma regulatory factor